MNKFFALSLSLLVLSCSSMTMKMEAPYQSAVGHGKVQFEKSYDLASYPWICGFTAIFYGGGCWVYLAMPMVPQEKIFIADAKAELESKLGVTDVSLIEPKIEKTSWSKSPTKFEYQPDSQ